MKKENQKKVDAAFKHNKGVKKLYVTADGTAFLNKNNATIHARNLDNTKVELVTREGKSEEVKEKKPKEKASGSDETPKGDKVEGRIDPSEVTEEQQVLRLVKDFTVEELNEMAKEFKFPPKQVKDLKEEDLARKLVTETTESEKELLAQRIEERVNEEEKED